MARPRRLTLLIAAALCAAALAPACASAAERTVRPVQTYTLASGWAATPSSALAHDVLADAVADPAVPDTASGFIAAHGNGALVSEVGFAAPALTTGEAVTGVRLHAYFGTGSGRSLTVELRSGATLLGFGFVPAGQAAGWHDVDAWVTPTLAQLGDLRMRATTGGSGASTDVKVYAAYVVVATAPTATGTVTGDDAPTPSGNGNAGGAATTTGGDNHDPGTNDDQPTGAEPPSAPAITLPVQTLSIAGSGAVSVPLTCQLAAGCTGTISTRLIGVAARPARRRKVNDKKSRGPNRFRLAAGQSKRVPVALDRRTSRFVKRKRRAKVAVTITVDGAAPVTTQVTVVQRRVARRR